MIKTKYIKNMKKSACIAAAVFMLGACGQANNADTATTAAQPAGTEASAPSEEGTTAAEKTSVEETKEDSSAEDSKENTDKNESQEEVNDASDEETGEKADKTENAEESDKEDEAESSDAAEEDTEQAEDAPAQGSQKSVNDIYQEIESSISLNSPMLVPDDFIMNYYGIDVSTLDEYVFSMSEAAISAETVVILKAKDAGSTGALSASLQTVIDQKRSEMENYLPDQFQIVDKSSVQVKGNYVYLVISEQADAISRIIQADIQ